MGTNLRKARELAKDWWEHDSAAHSRSRGYAVCDACPGQIPKGEGCLCNSSRIGDWTPDLVCESCFNRLPYTPWSGGSGLPNRQQASSLGMYRSSLGAHVDTAARLRQEQCRQLARARLRQWVRRAYDIPGLGRVISALVLSTL